jgi:hypothetical protein
MSRRLGRSTILTVAILAVVALTMAIAAVAAGAASVKQKSTTSVAIGSQGTLVSGGIDITVSYSCFPSGFGGGKGGYGGYANFGDARVTDLNGNQGFSFWNPKCIDKKVTTVVFVPGFFQPGDGAASVFVCGFDCNGTSREIKIS